MVGEDCAFEAAKEDNILILAIVEKKRGALFSDELLIALCSIFVRTWNEELLHRRFQLRLQVPNMKSDLLAPLL